MADILFPKRIIYEVIQSILCSPKWKQSPKKFGVFPLFEVNPTWLSFFWPSSHLLRTMVHFCLK